MIDDDACSTIDDKVTTEVELWLLAEGNALIDYISMTHWPYKYAATRQEVAREEELLSLIRAGESEVCEFKPSIDLGNEALKNNQCFDVKVAIVAGVSLVVVTVIRSNEGDD